MKKIFIILSLLFLACNSDKRIPEKKLASIIKEIYIIDATSEISMSYIPNNADLYDAVFEKYGYTKDDFNRSMKYYSLRAGKMQSLHKLVDTLLIEQEKKYVIPAKIESLSRNIIHLDSFYIKLDSNFVKRDFNIALTEKGIYDISVKYKFFKEDSTIKPRLKIHLVSSEGDTLKDRSIDTLIIKDTVFNSYKFKLTVDSDTFKILKGFWLDYDSVNIKKTLKKVYKKKFDTVYNGRQHLIISNINIKYNFKDSKSFNSWIQEYRADTITTAKIPELEQSLRVEN